MEEIIINGAAFRAIEAEALGGAFSSGVRKLPNDRYAVQVDHEVKASLALLSDDPSDAILRALSPRQ